MFLSGILSPPSSGIPDEEGEEMALIVVEGLGNTGGIPLAIAGNLGQTQTVTQAEVTRELVSRGYSPAEAAKTTIPITPPVLTQTPVMTRVQAINKALDSSLRLYSLSEKCTKLGGCSLSGSRFRAIVTRAAILATSYLRTGSVTPRTPSISPSYAPPDVRMLPAYSPAISPGAWQTGTPPAWAISGLSPLLSGIGGTLYGLGQAEYTVSPPKLTYPSILPLEQPEMTRWDWIAVISNAAQGVASTLEAYANARAQRERAGETATLTAAQVKSVVDQAIMQNPTLKRKDLESAAAGAGGDVLPKGTPGWVVPVVIGTAVVAVVATMKK